MLLKKLGSAGIMAIVGVLMFAAVQVLSDLSSSGPSASSVRALQEPHAATIIALEGIIWYSTAVVASVAGILTGLASSILPGLRITRFGIVLASALWSLPVFLIYSSAPLPVFVGLLSFCFSCAGAAAFAGKLATQEARPSNTSPSGCEM